MTPRQHFVGLTKYGHLIGRERDVVRLPEVKTSDRVQYRHSFVPPSGVVVARRPERDVLTQEPFITASRRWPGRFE
jgi:hypothetical protein